MFKYRILFSTIAVLICAIVFNTGHYAHGDGNGAPAGRTGSPGDGLTCANTCHTGSAVTAASGWITSNIPAGGYTPGMTYTITATATFNGRNEFGFEVSPQDLAGNRVGVLSNLSTQTQILISGKYITHTSTGTAGVNTRTWNFSWTAPVSGTGSFKFYGAFNCTNNNNLSSGDLIYTDNLSINEAPTSGLDCGAFAITAPGNIACDSVITPIVKLQNYGTSILDSVDIKYFVDAATPDTFHWVGTLASQTSTLVTLPSVIVNTVGTHTITATTLNPNDSTDLMTNNDMATRTFNLNFVGSTLPFSEGFESTTFPPSGWQRINPDGLTTWARSTAAHKTGVASAKMDNYNNSSVGSNDELITPPLDLTTDPAPTLTFQVAYRLYTNPIFNPNHSDTLSVYISTDCAATWTLLYKKFGTALSTATPAYSTAAFTPSATQWRLESINLAPYQTCSNAFIRFVNTTEYENNLYLDDIYINGPAGISNTTTASSPFSLFPNPANSQVTIRYHADESALCTWTIYDLSGKIISEKHPTAPTSEGDHVEYLDVEAFPPGMYFIRMTVGNKTFSESFSIVH